jgi:hypothetical protein
VKIVLAHFCGEESMAITLQLSLLVPYGMNKAFQHLHVECLINGDPLGYQFKMDDTPDVEKVDQHCFELGL